MTNPQPEEKSGPWQAILKAAEGLDQPLRFIIVFGVLLAVLFIAAPNISVNQLILLAILLIGGMILYVWWDYRHFRHPADPVPPTPPDDDSPRPVKPTPVSRQRGEELAQLYLWHLFDQCQHLSMADVHRRAQQKPWEKLPIDAIFTALDVAATGVERTGRKWGFLGQAGLDEPGQREAALAAVSREKRLVLLGQPGSGKSTLVSFMAYCLVGEALAQAGVDDGANGVQARLKNLHDQGWTLPALLPARIILRDYAARGLPAGQGLWEFLAAELSRAKPSLADYLPELERQLQRRGGLLLLDGLDEVPLAHQRRDQLREAIKTFARDFEKVRILVTSRPYACDANWQLPGFARADLLDFNAAQITSYIEG